MFARPVDCGLASRAMTRARVLPVFATVLALSATVRADGPHQKTAVSLTSTEHTEYRILKGDTEVGREKVEKKVFGNNTVVFVIDAGMEYAPGLTMDQHIELTVEEESYFPRSLHILKTVTQPDSTSFEHAVDVDMFSNVAVVSSTLRNQVGTRRLVVPTGVAIEDIGVIAYHYQILFWYDRQLGGGQRFQWLDPISVNLDSGEIKQAEEQTISVMGKKSKVRVFKLDREKVGPATLWVDKDGTIVRGEQNMFVYELVSRKNS